MSAIQSAGSTPEVENSGVLFQSLCDALDRIRATKAVKKKCLILSKFLWLEGKGKHVFNTIRLLLPQYDRMRANLGIQEATIGLCIVEALELSKTSPSANILLKWKQCSNEKAGNFSELASSVLADRLIGTGGRVSIASLNTMIDNLASTSRRERRVSVFRELLMSTDCHEMTWIIKILLRDMKIGLGEKSIFNAIHPEAHKLFDICCDLKEVCSHISSGSIEGLKSVSPRIIVGEPLQFQNSLRVETPSEAWDKMKGKKLIAEVKFDGDRMQIHKNGNEVKYWSRNIKEHPEYDASLGDIIRENVQISRCILDGELLVWDYTEERYIQRTRTSNKTAALAMLKGEAANEEICFVVFDILYVEGVGSTLEHPLRERHEFLRRLVRPCGYRLLRLTPESSVSKFSILPQSCEQLESFFFSCIENGEEGIVIKDLSSKWEPQRRAGIRDGRWMKIKPDYVDLGTDMDLLIIGGYYGTGKNGGKISSFLLAVIEPGDPPFFHTVCRCSTGLSEDDLSLVQTTLEPYFVPNSRASNRMPAGAFYRLTNSQRERPDVWISQPEKSIVLQIREEQRLYRSRSFKVGHTFRFPRIEKIRFDKGWADVLSLEEFGKMVDKANARNGSMGKYNPLEKGSAQKGRAGRMTAGSSRTEIIAHMQLPAVSNIERKNSLFEGLIFRILNCSVELPRERIHEIVIQAGGAIVAGHTPAVTHLLATEPKGLLFHSAVASNRDVVNTQWLVDSWQAGTLLPISPKLFLNLSPSSAARSSQVLDRYGDPFFLDLTVEDLKKIFSCMKTLPRSKAMAGISATRETQNNSKQPPHPRRPVQNSGNVISEQENGGRDHKRAKSVEGWLDSSDSGGDLSRLSAYGGLVSACVDSKAAERSLRTGGHGLLLNGAPLNKARRIVKKSLVEDLFDSLMD